MHSEIFYFKQPSNITPTAYVGRFGINQSAANVYKLNIPWRNDYWTTYNDRIDKACARTWPQINMLQWMTLPTTWRLSQRPYMSWVFCTFWSGIRGLRTIGNEGTTREAFKRLQQLPTAVLARQQYIGLNHCQLLTYPKWHYFHLTWTVVTIWNCPPWHLRTRPLKVAWAI